MAEVGEPLHGLAGRAHHVDALAVALGAEGDALAVGREGGSGVRGRAVRGEVDRVAAADALQVDVRVPRRVAHEHERRGGRTDLGLALLAGQVGELYEGGRDGRGGAPAALADSAPDLEGHAEQDHGGESEGSEARPPPPLAQRLDDASLGDRAPEAVEVEGEVARRLESLVGVLLQAVLDDEVEGLRDPRVGFRGRRRLVPEDRADQLGRARARERAAAREHLVEHGAQREDVGPVVCHLSLAPARGPGTPTVPIIAPGFVGRAAVGDAAELARPGEQGACRARPKSRIFTRPSLRRKRFSGLMSRCTRPFSCAAARPSATRAAFSAALRTPNGPWRSRERIVSPSSSSVTTKSRLPSCPVSCDRDDVGVRERRDRLRLRLEAGERVAVLRKCSGSTLIATSRSSRGSRARYTSPILPPRGETRCGRDRGCVRGSSGIRSLEVSAASIGQSRRGTQAPGVYSPEFPR